MAELPLTVTPTDEWLAAVHGELVGLRADLAAASGGGMPAPAPVGGRVELVEPASATVGRATSRTKGPR